MPSLTFTLAKEYGRHDGNLPLNKDFGGSQEDNADATYYIEGVYWEAPHHELPGQYRFVAGVPGDPESVWYQGSPPMNGLSIHFFNLGSKQQSAALIGVPLDNWTGHRLQISTRREKDGEPPQRQIDYYDLVFVSDPVNYPPQHSPSALAMGGFAVPIDDWRTAKAQLADAVAHNAATDKVMDDVIRRLKALESAGDD